jgi:hypothetical protein
MFFFLLLSLFPVFLQLFSFIFLYIYIYMFKKLYIMCHSRDLVYFVAVAMYLKYVRQMNVSGVLLSCNFTFFCRESPTTNRSFWPNGSSQDTNKELQVIKVYIHTVMNAKPEKTGFIDHVDYQVFFLKF